MLSKRLQEICNLVDSTYVVDIGCDHALIDIYLTINNHICTAIDNKETVLEKTIQNIKKYNLEDKINVVCSDGLNNYGIKGNESVILAGMGTSNILNILNNNQINKINTLIVQSNNDLDILRRKICKMGFYIDKEIAVYDKKYYCIIRFKRGKKIYSYLNYYYGLSNNKSYYKYLYNKTYETYKKVPYRNIAKKIKYKLLLINIR